MILKKCLIMHSCRILLILPKKTRHIFVTLCETCYWCYRNAGIFNWFLLIDNSKKELVSVLEKDIDDSTDTLIGSFITVTYDYASSSSLIYVTNWSVSLVTDFVGPSNIELHYTETTSKSWFRTTRSDTGTIQGKISM